MALAAAVGLSVVTAVVPSRAAGDIPWKDTTFEHSGDADVKDVLRLLLRANGQQVIFKPGVKGTVSARIENMPLRAAFTMLITETGLEYAYDSATNMVTISAVGKTDQVAQDFINLGMVEPDALMGAVREFGLGGNIKINRATNTALVKGAPEQVKLLKDLITDMANNAKSVHESRTSGSSASSKASQDASAAARAAAEAAVAEQKAQAEKVMLEGLLNQEVRIIPLTYANVGSSTKKFYDQSVTVPGIEETINKLLGDFDSMAKNLPKDQAEKLKEMAAPLNLARPVLSVDTRTNSVIVRGTHEAVEEVAKLVKELDKPVPLIEIEVIIVKAEEGISDQLGVNWSTGGRFADSGNRSGGINTGIATANLFNPNVQQRQETVAGTGGSPASTSVGVTQDAAPLVRALSLLPGLGASDSVLAGFVMKSSKMVLQAQLRAFEADNRAQTIASPRVVTMNNSAAKMSKRDSRYIPIQGASGSAGTIKEIDAGVILDILPSVIARENSADTPLVRLNITASNTVPNVAAGASSVSVNGNVVTTEVMIPNETTFVLGGLLDDFRSKTSSGIPGLRNIPVLGFLFGQEADSNNLSETIFFITPKVVWPNEIAPADIATRNYMKQRQASLSETGKMLQKTATSLGKPNIHHDE
ncbi:MAG: hypothetical protein H7840_01915 [Alphaproteobacteria bacterium]